MYGPPPDPRQKLAPVEIFDVPEAYLWCFGIGLLLTLAALWRRPGHNLRAALFITGQTIALTAPLTVFVDTWVYGSFPTIDKAGSLLFYLDGVHERMFFHPIASLLDPAASLIGVHVGHLWITAFFDTFLTPMGAFNAQALLYPILAWWCSWWLFNTVTKNPRVSMLMAFPFGMGLHLFRDLNWYTIEKAAIFLVPLFLNLCFLAWRDGGKARWGAMVLLPISMWINVYLGLINAGMLIFVWAALWLSSDSHRLRFTKVAVGALVCTSPLIVWQWWLTNGNMQLGTPEAFLWERAALDSFTLSPLRWNRLEVHRSLNVVAFGLAIWGLRRSRWVGVVRLASMAALAFFLLSLGPTLHGFSIDNPVYMAVRSIVPGFWRVAKPEVFFHVTWLMLLGIAAIQLQRSQWSQRSIGIWYTVFVFAWLLMVRTHPAYPPMTQPVPVQLDPNWAEDVFKK
ncbi:MAG: hypothetical protein CL930_11730 [Deltaproteobacteria bacterium]|nr:hypothetical protein [Deltaproteobacteria bacterium]